MPFTEYAEFDALGLAELVRKREVQPSELVEESIRRIEALNPATNAVVYKAYDTARALAAQQDRAAPIGPLHPAQSVKDIEKAGIWLQVNGADKQRSDIGKLIWSIAETIAYLSKYFRLEAGDLIYTGTPEGVGPVVRGDRMVGGVDGLGTLSVQMV